MLVLLGGYRISTISRFDTITRSRQNTTIAFTTLCRASSWYKRHDTVA